jgi:outer membrane protein assembly factor BamB
MSKPVASGLTLLFASEKGIVYGVNTVDRQLKFQLETAGKIQAPLTSANGMVFVADSQSRLYCINQSNGHRRWEFSSGAPISQEPKVIGGHVYVVPQREGLAAIDVQTGHLLWQRVRATALVAVSEKRVYASDLSDNLLILDRENGNVLGVLNLREYSLRVSNDRTDRVYLSTPSGTVICLREMNSDYPIFHRNPDERPLLPELAPDEPAAAEAKASGG